MRLARRIIVIWAIDALALWALASIVPGLDLTSWVWAFLAIAVIGLLNALLRPFLLMAMLPFTVLSLGLFSIVLNAGIILLAQFALAGFQVADFVSAIWIVLGIAAVNTIVTGALSINDDESFYRNVILRFARRSDVTRSTEEPGLIIFEIDGLSMNGLRRAIDDGYMPTLERWIESGAFKVAPWICGLPSQTSSSQAGILYGRNDDIPAFRWYEKSSQRLMISNRPWTAEEIHQRLSDGTGLLAHGGSSLSNVVSGDATVSALTLSTLRDHASNLRQRSNSYYLFFLNPYSFSRTFVLMVWEIIREIGQRWRGRLRRNSGPETRGGSFPFLRAVSNVYLRDLNLYLLIEDMIRGTPIVYSTFLGYDVVAHHVGPLNPDALRTLQQFDDGLAVLERTTQRAPRPYEFVLLSDHGQSHGATFRQRYGLTLERLVERALDGEVSVSGPPEDNEGWANLNALITQAIQGETVAGRTARRVFRDRITDGYVEFGPPAQTLEDPGSEVVVCASGNLGLIYFTENRHRLTLEDLTVRYPGLISTLVGHQGIGFVLVRSGLYGAVVIGKKGINYLDLGEVDGEDPLGIFDDDAADQLRRLDGFDNVGDLLVNSMYDPETGEVAAFEELVGSHGGLGGDQTRPFVIYPATWPEPAQPISSAREMYHQFRTWLAYREGPETGTGNDPSHAAEETGGSARYWTTGNPSS